MPPNADLKMAEMALIASPSAAREAMAEALFQGVPGEIYGPRHLPETPHSAVVFMPDRSSPSTDDAATVVQWAKQTQAPHLLLVSSAEVHEPSHRHAGFLGESQLRTRKPTNPISRRWLELEGRVAADLEGSAVRLTIVRPTALSYAAGKNLWSRLLSGRWALVPAGYDPSIQWMSMTHLADVVRRLVGQAAPSEPVQRIFQVSPEGVEPLRAALRRRGIRTLSLPSFVLRWIHQRQGWEPGEVEFMRYAWTVSGQALETHLAKSSQAELPSLPLPHQRQVPPRHDPFGLDPQYIDGLGKTLFRFLHNAYWRIEWRGLEHVPKEGPGVLVGVHRGHQPWDGVMVLHRLVQSLRRHPRFLLHPTLIKHPFLAPYMLRCGGLNACRENGDWVLAHQGLLGIFPEGIRGAFTPYKDAYRLQSFGRHDFVKFALRARVPIVPFVIAGSAEIFPIFGKLDWPWWKRVSEWPCFPITPTLSMLPLPSKWHALVLEPLPVHQQYGPEAAKDNRLVRAISDQVKARMADALEDIRARRPNIFFGSVFEQPDWAPPSSDLRQEPGHPLMMPSPQSTRSAEALIRPARRVAP